MKPEVQAWLDRWPAEEKAVLTALHDTFESHLPPGFEAGESYGMIGFVVPHSIYPKGYHANPKLPLPLIGFTKQKHYYAIYHLGVYAFPELAAWFEAEYTARYGKLDHGKSCLRFKSKEKIPFELLGILATKISVDQWIAAAEANAPGTR